jgi:hypothetical protein
MATQEPGTTQLSADALASALAPLADALGDRLLTPASAEFVEAATVFVGGPERTPAAIARVRTTEEACRSRSAPAATTRHGTAWSTAASCSTCA